MSCENKVLKTFVFIILLLKVCGIFKLKNPRNKLLNLTQRLFSLIIAIIILFYIIFYTKELGLTISGKSIEIVLLNFVKTMDRTGYLMFPVVNLITVSFSNENYEKFFNDLEDIHEILGKQFSIKFNYRRLKLANFVIFFITHLATIVLFRQFIVVILINDPLGFLFIIYFIEAFIFITQRCLYFCIVFHYFVILRCIQQTLMSSKIDRILREKENILQLITMILNSIDDFNGKFGLIAFLTIGKK